jgi:hypothetical protein
MIERGQIKLTEPDAYRSHKKSLNYYSGRRSHPLFTRQLERLTAQVEALAARDVAT